MYGLLINRLYLEEILDGRKDCDARPFPTDRRGRIALLDNKSLKVLGFADLVRVEVTDYAHYRAWQTTMRYQIPLDPLGDRRAYYLYRLRNVTRIATPLTVPTYSRDHVWVFIDDRVRRQATVQKGIADFLS
ncbi:MAG: hypothetical protein MJZ38_04865 [archaeon]|nr:hypothetical protein [archaeon]